MRTSYLALLLASSLFIMGASAAANDFLALENTYVAMTSEGAWGSDLVEIM